MKCGKTEVKKEDNLRKTERPQGQKISSQIKRVLERKKEREREKERKRKREREREKEKERERETFFCHMTLLSKRDKVQITHLKLILVFIILFKISFSFHNII